MTFAEELRALAQSNGYSGSRQFYEQWKAEALSEACDGARYCSLKLPQYVSPVEVIAMAEADGLSVSTRGVDSEGFAILNVSW